MLTMLADMRGHYIALYNACNPHSSANEPVFHPTFVLSLYVCTINWNFLVATDTLSPYALTPAPSSLRTVHFHKGRWHS